MKTLIRVSALIALLVALPCSAMISVGQLTKEKAAEFGITMKHRPNGDAGILVWLEFKKKGFLEKFTYAEFRMVDEKRKHLVSTRLQPHPVSHDQPGEVVSVAFSADPSQLDKCSFMIVAYGSSHGDVGYILSVKDLIDLKKVGDSKPN